MTEDNEKIAVHMAGTEVREGILDHQVQNCPACGKELEQSFGLAGGGFGAYGYCVNESCSRNEQIIWKCTFDD